MNLLPTVELPDFLHLLFNFLSDKKISYAVARNYETLASADPGRDMDILVKEKHIPSIIRFINQLGICITGIVQREYVTSVFCLGIRWGDHMSIGLDLVHKLNYKAAVYLDISKVLERSRPYEDGNLKFQIPDKTDEMLIILMEGLIVGKYIRPDYWEKIITHLNKSDIAEKRLAETISRQHAKNIIALVSRKDLDGLMAIRKKITRTLIGTAIIKHPVYMLTHSLSHIKKELAIRFFNRPLFTICFLGPDGAGKSTLISRIILQLKGAFGNITIRHLKPVFIFKKRTVSRGVVTEPHAMPLRGRAMSNIKIILWWLELWADRSIKRPRTLSLDIFDRCMWDVLIDPKRYRFSGSPKLLSALLKLSPKIDMVAVIIASPENIQQRKAEVPETETVRQIQAYRNLAETRNFLLLENDGLVDDAIQPFFHKLSRVKISQK